MDVTHDDALGNILSQNGLENIQKKHFTSPLQRECNKKLILRTLFEKEKVNGIRKIFLIRKENKWNLAGRTWRAPA